MLCDLRQGLTLPCLGFRNCKAGAVVAGATSVRVPVPRRVSALRTVPGIGLRLMNSSHCQEALSQYHRVLRLYPKATWSH